MAGARALLGADLVSTVGGVDTSGRIVEVEAYLGPADPASHGAARIGRTARNDPMFGAPGTAYVYRIYGVHRCFNVVTGDEGFPAAVLVRALEPRTGMEAMARRRGRGTDLCSGPGRLAQALGIEETLNGHDLDRAPLRILPGAPVPDSAVQVSGRIGISRATDWPLRFTVAGSPHVSRAGPGARPISDYRKAISRLESLTTLESR